MKKIDLINVIWYYILDSVDNCGILDLFGFPRDIDINHTAKKHEERLYNFFQRNVRFWFIIVGVGCATGYQSRIFD